jgi:hypothetical protein
MEKIVPTKIQTKFVLNSSSLIRTINDSSSIISFVKLDIDYLDVDDQ